MCLEPFAAAGLFILGRGVLLLGVVRETEEERKGRASQEEQAHGPALPLEELALPLLIIRSTRKSQARLERRGKGRQCTLPEARLPHSS